MVMCKHCLFGDPCSRHLFFNRYESNGSVYFDTVKFSTSPNHHYTKLVLLSIEVFFYMIYLFVIGSPMRLITTYNNHRIQQQLRLS